jgi:hypothetical protein
MVPSALWAPLWANRHRLSILVTCQRQIPKVLNLLQLPSRQACTRESLPRGRFSQPPEQKAPGPLSTLL